MGDLKTLGAVEMVLGLMGVSLGTTLLQVHTYFKTELSVLLTTAGLSILVGFSLVCGGRKPSYACVKFNMAFNLSLLVLSTVTLGSMVRHVPYREDRYCDSYCNYSCSSTLILLRAILIIVVTMLVMQTLVALLAAVQGYCCIMLDSPKPPEDTDHMGSVTSEPLCAPPPPVQVAPAYYSAVDGQASFPVMTASSHMNTAST